MSFNAVPLRARGCSFAEQHCDEVLGHNASISELNDHDRPSCTFTIKSYPTMMTIHSRVTPSRKTNRQFLMLLILSHWAMILDHSVLRKGSIAAIYYDLFLITTGHYNSRDICEGSMRKNRMLGSCVSCLCIPEDSE